MKITQELLEMGREDTGGFNKDQIELIGLDWEWFKKYKDRLAWGTRIELWKKKVIGMDISDETAAEFVHMGGLSEYRRKKRKQKCSP